MTVRMFRMKAQRHKRGLAQAARESRWAERESNPHSQRRLIYSQRSSPPAQSARDASIMDLDDRTLRVATLLSAHVIFLSAAVLRIVRGGCGHHIPSGGPWWV